jgi:hypothetical protein
MNLPSAPVSKFSLIAIVAGFAFMASSQLHAGASNKNGNPYGNGTFFQTTGTFSAVVRGENLSGTIMFSTGVSTNGANTNSGGSSVISYGGNTYMGNVAGMWNPSSGNIEGQIWGGQGLSGSNSSLIYPEAFNTNHYPALIPVTTNQPENIIVLVTNSTITVIATNTDGTPIISTNTTVTTLVTGSTNVLSTNYISVEPSGTNYVNNGVYMSGSFDGNVQNSYPNQTFYASGSLIQQQLAETPINGTINSSGVPANGVEGTTPVQISSVTIPISVQGLRIADAYTSFTTINNTSNIPYSATYYTLTNPPQ